MLDKDQFYQVILDGLSRYLESPFVADVLATIIRYPDPEFAHALNKNQVASKTWLIHELAHCAGLRHGTIAVLGGWHGVLAAMLLDDTRLDIDLVLNVDIDPACAPVAETLNRRHLGPGRFAAVTADMYELDYQAIPYTDHEGRERSVRPDLVVNTSCEHLARFDDWLARIPAGMLTALQSNDMVAEPSHVNCVASLDDFRDHAPLAEELYAGAMHLRRYTRFMLIGRR